MLEGIRRRIQGWKGTTVSRFSFDRARLDPTRVRNQPALQSSTGLIWLVVGAIFVVVCLVPFLGLAVMGRPAATAAVVAAVLTVAAYAAMVVVRLTVSPGPRRLQRMAICFIAMAAVALVGMIVCVLIQWSAARP